MTTQTKTTFARLEAQRLNRMAQRMVDQIGVTSLEHRLSAEDAIWTALKLRVESVYAREQAKSLAGIQALSGG